MNNERHTLFAGAEVLLPGGRFVRADLLVAGRRIAAVIENPAPESRPAFDERIDCSGMLILPGLVNCHCHAAMTLLRSLGTGLPLDRWLREAIFPVEAKMRPDDVRAGTLWGALEMLAGGITAVADMYDFPAACEEAFAMAGLRASVCRVGLAFPDGSPAGRLAECRDHLARGCDGLINRDASIHSEYLTDERFCRELAAVNREFGRPLHFHVSETRREHEECIARHGRTPVAYLAATGLLDHGGYAAHCVWCTDDDFRILREHGVSIVHNPTSNLKLGSGVARIADALALGVNVALGTDGTASNDNLNLFEEMHLAALLANGLGGGPGRLLSRQVLEMATAGGARALGRTDCGELRAGMLADLCIVDLDRPHLHPHGDLADLAVYSMQAADVAMTVVDGEIVYDRGAWPRVDAERARFELLSSARRLHR